jgi:hypothetical protein
MDDIPISFESFDLRGLHKIGDHFLDAAWRASVIMIASSPGKVNRPEI